MEASIHGGCTRTSQCASNIRNVVLSVLQYAHRRGAFTTGTWAHPAFPPEHRLSWYAAILPELEKQELRDSLDEFQPWSSDGNDQIACTRIGDLNCPDVPGVGPGGLAATPYIGIGGLGLDSPSLPKGHARAGVFGYERRTTLADLKDGAAYTMVIAESGRVAGSWLAGGPATVRGIDPAKQPYVGPGRRTRSRRTLIAPARYGRRGSKEAGR
jgi:Protein of unknown function (DUF1559)